MAILVRNLKLSLDYDAKEVQRRVGAALRISALPLTAIKLEKLSLDARGEAEPFYVGQVRVELPYSKAFAHNKNIVEVKATNTPRHYPAWRGKPPVITGSGPAGLFAALEFARAGACPIILERGEDVVNRARAVENAMRTGVIDPESNVQFGEGGAGTFSDGKLLTRIKGTETEEILQTFVNFGAPPDILFLQKPHIGTDLLRQVVLNLRRQIVELGGVFLFKTRLTGIRSAEKGVSAALTDQGEIRTDKIFLAVGNAARDTFHMLADTGLSLTAKPFAVGLRVEHPQELINRARYGKYFADVRLPAADYQESVRTSDGHSVYSFCMCPGGKVIAAASEAESIVTNGMSFRARDLANANSAIVTPVDAGVYGEGLFAGMDFQTRLERRAYKLAGSCGKAPAELLGDFVTGAGRLREFSNTVKPSYEPGVSLCDLRELLGHELGARLAEALFLFDRKIPDFALPAAVLTGPETRTSSPLRILRDHNYESVSHKGIFPIGEGAGYAGGITSSAVDGMRAARKTIERAAFEGR